MLFGTEVQHQKLYGKCNCGLEHKWVRLEQLEDKINLILH
jgi:hypothetical protein